MTGIAKKAGLAQHTFYNHYETRDELSDRLIDSILDEIFSKAREWNVSWGIVSANLGIDRKVGNQIFQICKDHLEVAKIIKTDDIDCLLINRLKDNFERFLYEYTDRKSIDISTA